ncbi:hypothetical protein [Marinobacterium sedimentorum]|nr:hypothetical protein [Marinobacterium sedimentorum]
MFGLDVYSVEVLVPSVVGVLAIASVMIFGFVRVCNLINREPPRD